MLGSQPEQVLLAAASIACEPKKFISGSERRVLVVSAMSQETNSETFVQGIVVCPWSTVVVQPELVQRQLCWGQRLDFRRSG